MKQCNNFTNILKIILILSVSSCTSEVTVSSVDDNLTLLPTESINTTNLAGRSGQIKTFNTEFHIYSTEMAPSDVPVFFNGISYFLYASELNDSRALLLEQTYQLILNLAISGQSGRIKFM
ncbi:MAG: hypothetical protein ACI808_002215 [Paraglaciecola sp.]|jgi:hypothetical protein